MHGNDIQMMLCIVKLGVVSSMYGDFWEESGWRCTYAQSSPDFLHTHGFINLKKIHVNAKSSFCAYVHF